jgi:hypothetical protein
MAFIKNNKKQVISFAEYSDVLSLDQRLFEANEGLSTDIVEELLIRSTERILNLIRSTDWWRDLYLSAPHPVYRDQTSLPQVDANKILARQHDFTELCAMYALWNYILPKIADFSKEDNAERAKIGFYQGKFQFLFDEIVNGGDWYDLDGSGAISSNEKAQGHQQLKRIR